MRFISIDGGGDGDDGLKFSTRARWCQKVALGKQAAGWMLIMDKKTGRGV